MKIKISRIIAFLLTILCGCERGNDLTDLPEAHFSYTSIASFPVTVNFVNTSIGSGGPSTFSWDFGDGSPYSATTDPVHTYTQPGVYQVRLVQTPAAGPMDTVIKLINLGFPQGPAGSSNRFGQIQQADFNFAISSRAHLASFTNTSSGATSYLWNFGDGSTTTTDSSTVVHKFSAGGTYHVKLSAINSDGTDTCGATIVFQP